MMKVLLYSHAFPPAVGGVETIVALLARRLAEQISPRVEVTVATRTPRGALDDAALPFRIVRRPGAWQLVRLIRQADVVHIAGPAMLPLALGWLFRRPVVVEHHGFQAVCPNGQLLYEPTRMPCPGHFMARRHRECLRCNARDGFFHSFKLWLATFPRRWLCRRVRSNIAPTTWLAGVLQLPRTTTIPHGIADPGLGLAAYTPGAPFTFAFVGRLVTAKGVQVLLEAARLLRDRSVAFHLKIIGDGPERSVLETQARTWGLGDRVSFLGYLPPPELEHALQDAGAIVVPSLGGEVFGLAALENMMRGRLVIVSDLGPLSEVVGDAGLRFATGDAGALALCLQRALECQDALGELGARARQRAMRLFSMEQMEKQHLLLYQGFFGGERVGLPTTTNAGLHDFLVEQVLVRFAAPGRRAADLGAGSGALAVRLRELGLEVVAVDENAELFQADVSFVRLDLNQPDFAAALGAGSFDLVTSVEVIEHLESPVGFLRNVRRLLRPDGVALITTPNVDSAPARVKFLLRGTIRMMDEVGEPTHVSPIFWDLLTRQYLSRAGLELVEHRLYPPRGYQVTRRRYAWAFRILAGMLPGETLLGDNHVLVLRPGS